MENYLYPFFWQHGESEAVLSEYMDKISESGMGAACIEARPHPEFAGEGWWRDLGVIVKKAKENGMKLWILDDSHFPTGYANGRIEKDFPQYKKLYLYNRRFDVTGPIKGARINAGILVGRPWTKPGLGDKQIVGVYLAKRSSNRMEDAGNFDAVDADSLTLLEGAFQDDLITLDIPAGSYSVFVVFTTREGGEDATKEYLNPLVPEATQVLIDEVYEPHYAHFGEEFGKTILAFFSDEPRFGNIKGTKAVIGTDMVLPWRPGLEEALPFEKKYLPLLWHQANGFEHEIRFRYMDMITKLYSECFTGVLARWCHAHGVAYLGHNIEDDGAHCRLGYGAGHYFRGQKGQDYAGVDLIGTQIVPGMPYHHDAFSTGGNNGEFYHFALGKLAASAAHLDPEKRGRAMCEAFGAYGWNEGLKLMKWLTDHLISRGINTLVPHAFDPKEFPDWDCAPHFYAHGNNPQFRYFRTFTDYANRLLTLFNGGQTRARAGVLYNGMLEWAGTCMPVEKVLRELTEQQIDADIVSEDYLDTAKILDGKLVINEVAFDVLFVPQAARIPGVLKEKLDRLAAQGVKIIYIGKDMGLDGIAAACEDIREIRLSQPFREIVYYHYRKAGQDVLMLFNENIVETFEGDVRFSDGILPEAEGRVLYRYDAFRDSYCEVACAEGRIHLSLAPYESAVFVYRERVAEFAQSLVNPGTMQRVKNPFSGWKLSFASAKEYPAFTEIPGETEVKPLNTIPGFENVTGTAAYETRFEKPEGRRLLLDLGTAYEVAEVFVNDASAGIRICPPYRFDITELLSDGENRLRIEITNTVGASVRDGLSQYLVIEPFGLTDELGLWVCSAGT